MNFIKRNPRRSMIFGSYILAFIVFFMFAGVSLGTMLLLYLGITLVFMLVFRIDCLAVLGNLHYQRDNVEKAEKIYQYVIDRNTTSPAAHVYYATYLMRKGEAAAAAPLLDKALRLSSGNPLLSKNIKLAQGSCQWLMGNTSAAIELLEKMRNTYDYVNDRVLSTLGYLYVLQNDLEKGKELSRKSLEDNPQSHAAWDNLGQIFYREKSFPEAREAFQKALECKENLPDSLYYLGLIAQAEGDSPGARVYFDKALGCTINAFNTVTKEQIENAAKSL
jgi:tetratricopeptide (TPR) repeat protein